MHLKTIVIPTDFSENSKEASKFALQLCHKFDCNAAIFHAIDANPYALYGEYTGWQKIEITDETRKEAEKAMDHFIRAVGIEAPTTGRNVITTETIGESITNYIKERDADLVLMSTHGRKGIERVLMGSIAEHIIRHSTKPVLTGRPGSFSRKKLDSFKKVLYACDLQTEKDNNLTKAAEWAKALGATLHLVHVIDSTQIDIVYTTPFLADPATKKQLEENAKKQLQNLAASVDDICKTTTALHWYAGNPGSGVSEYADKNDIDMIVMSTHGRSGAARVLLGSIAERVARTATCPLLLYKHS